MKQKIKENLFEIMMIVLFLGMAVLVCPHNSINFDEFYTVYWCKCDWAEFLYQVLHDTSPFLYYFMIRPVMVLTGQSIFIARLFSLLSLLIMLLVGISFVKKTFGQKAAFFYMAILFLNPFMLQKSIEIRMYGWASAFTVLSGVMCYRLLKKPEKKEWIWFTVFSLLAAYTHYYAVLSMVFLYLGLLFWFWGTHNKKEVKNFFICGIVTVLAYLPFLLIAMAQIQESSGNWIPVPDSRLQALKELFYSEIPYSEFFYLGLMAAATVFAFIVFLKKRCVESYWSLVCCSALWGIVAFCVVFGELVKPIMLSRYLIMPACLLFLGMSFAAKYINKYVVLVICLIMALIAGIRFTYVYKTTAADETVKMLEFAEENIAEGDKVVLISKDDYLYNCVDYFVPQAQIIYIGDFDAEVFKKEKEDDIFWFLDNGEFIDKKALEEKGLKITEHGWYQFGYIDMEVYQIQ